MMFKNLSIALIAFLILSVPSFAAQKNLHGWVISVVDGDTLDVALDGSNKLIRVRIYGVNSPEKADPFFKAAKEFTKSHALSKKVKLLPRGKGYYGRQLAFVILPDGKSLGLELVRAGLARVYSNRFAPANQNTYERYQHEMVGAIMSGKGIWSKYRKGNKK